MLEDRLCGRQESAVLTGPLRGSNLGYKGLSSPGPPSSTHTAGPATLPASSVLIGCHLASSPPWAPSPHFLPVSCRPPMAAGARVHSDGQIPFPGGPPSQCHTPGASVTRTPPPGYVPVPLDSTRPQRNHLASSPQTCPSSALWLRGGSHHSLAQQPKLGPQEPTLPSSSLTSQPLAGPGFASPLNLSNHPLPLAPHHNPGQAPPASLTWTTAMALSPPVTDATLASWAHTPPTTHPPINPRKG